MIKYNKLTMNNYGPYKGTQEVSFPSEGVTTVYGQNFKGKTTLLNAFRFVFTGKILGRNKKYLTISHFVNRLAKKEGIKEFKIALEYSNDNNNYLITRKGTIDDNTDKVVKFNMLKNGNVLNRDQQVNELNSMLPEEVIRFFLFDRELLVEYEQLLDNNDTTTIIRESIDDILGFPLIEDSRDTLKDLQTEYGKEYTKLMKKVGKRDIVITEIEGLQVKIDEEQKEVNETMKNVESLRSEGIELKAKVDESNAARIILEEIKGFEISITGAKEKRDIIKESINNSLKDGWIFNLENLLSDYMNKDSKSSTQIVTRDIRELITKTINNHQCEICGNEIGEDKINELKMNLGSVESSRTSFIMKGYEDSNLQGNWVKYNDALEEIYTLNEKMDASSKKVRNIDDEEVEVNWKNYDKIQQLIERESAYFIKLSQNIIGYKIQIQNLKDLTSSDSGNEELIALNRKTNLTNELFTIFENSIDLFRTEMRKEVEKTASQYFKQIVAEDDFKKLKINDNYGMEIHHSDGSIVPNKSSGASLIVAISLIFSIHKNSSISGPLILDAPLEGLDGKRTPNVVSKLPDISKQIMLISTEKELDGKKSRNWLGHNLSREYAINRISAYHTEIIQIDE